MIREPSVIPVLVGNSETSQFITKKGITFKEVCRDIAARKFQSVYVLMDEEPFFIDQITDLLLESVLEESERNFNQIILYGADTDAISIINVARRFPIMPECQLIVIRETQLVRGIELLSSYVKNPLSSTILVINYKHKTLDRHHALAATTNKNGILYKSEKIPDYRMPSFITSLMQQRSIGIDPKATQILSDFFGNDLDRLNKELDKLVIVSAEKASKHITSKLIEQNVGISKEYNNFELIKALAMKGILKANRIAQYSEKNPKSSPIQMTLPILFSYFSNLLIYYCSKDRSESGLMTALGLWGAYQMKDYLLGMKNCPAVKIFNLINDIQTTDARPGGVENSSATGTDLLKELLYKILH